MVGVVVVIDKGGVDGVVDGGAGLGVEGVRGGCGLGWFGGRGP